MLYGILDACESNGATAVFPGRLDRAQGRLGVGRLRRRCQEIGDAFASVLASALVLIRSMSSAFLFTIVSMTQMMCASCSLDACIG